MSDHEEPQAEHSEFNSGQKLDKREATRALAWSMIFAFISKVFFPLASIYFISRVLGPAQLGIFYVISRIVQFSEVLRDAGLTQTYLADPEMTTRKQGSYHFVAIVTGAAPMLILCATSILIAQGFGIPELTWAIPLISIVSLINGFATIPRAQMLRAGQIKESGLLEVIGTGIGIAVAAILVAFNVGFVALVVQMIIGAVFSLVVSTQRFPVRQINASAQAFRDVGRKAMAVFAANGLNTIFLYGDQFIIGPKLGKVSSGLYGIASNLAMRPADLFAFPLTRTLMVAFSQSSVDKEKLGQVYGRAIAAAILFVIPIYVFLGIYAAPTMDILYGDAFKGSETVLAILSIYYIFRVFGNISGHALVPAGKHFLTFYPWIGCLALTGVLLWFAVPTKDLELVVWCFTAGAVFVYGTLVALAMRECSFGPEIRQRIVRSILSLLISVAFMIGIWCLPLDARARLGLAILTGPLIHLMSIGTIFAGNALKYLNRSGPKSLWREL